MWHLDNLALAFYLLAFLSLLTTSSIGVAVYSWFERRNAITVRSRDRVMFMRDFK